jgi:hypothetical protein
MSRVSDKQIQLAEIAADERWTVLPQTSAERKEYPIHSGVFRYFPAALAEVSRVSKFGNDKHCPEGELTHMRGLSMDHFDCILRHLIDHEDDPLEPESGLYQLAFVAWRALAALQEFLESEGAPDAPAATFGEAP